MPEGLRFYSVTYGKTLLVAYSAHVNRQQSWLVTKYVKHTYIAHKAYKQNFFKKTKSGTFLLKKLLFFFREIS